MGSYTNENREPIPDWLHDPLDRILAPVSATRPSERERAAMLDEHVHKKYRQQRGGKNALAVLRGRRRAAGWSAAQVARS